MTKRLFRKVLILTMFLAGCKANKTTSAFEGDRLSAPTAELVAVLVESDFVGTERVARQDETSVAFVNRRALMETATREELMILLDHPEGEVVATAFEALAERETENLKGILLDLSEGDGLVNYLKGDVFLEIPVIEYAYVYVLGYDFENPLNADKPVDIGLKPEEKAFIENRIKALRQRG